MALSDKKIDAVTLLQWGEVKGHPLAAHRAYARAIEAEVRGQDDALIRQLVEALEVTASDVCQVAHHKKRDQHGGGDVCPVQARHDEAIAAGRARLEGKP